MNSELKFWRALATVATFLAFMCALEILDLHDKIDSITKGCGL